MPELPEVETTRRHLAPLLAGRRIQSLEVRHPTLVRYPALPDFARGVEGARIEGVGRRGKFLLLHLAGGATLVIHLRMTGRLLYTEGEAEEKPHTHLLFHFEGGGRLAYSDARRFGGLWLLAPGEEDRVSGIHRLGIEPLGGGLTAGLLQEQLGKRRLPIKSALLDQSVIAGLGNIYADEALHRAGLHPQRPAAGLTQAEWERLADVIPPLLEEATGENELRMQAYLAGEGDAYSENTRLRVYGRAGKPCPVCGRVIEKIRLGGRSCHFCPGCQPEGSTEEPVC